MRRGQRVAAGALAIGLWIVTAAVGLVEIYLLRQTFLQVYGFFGSDYESGVTLSMFVVLIVGLLWAVFAIGTAEYHRKHVGQPGSWKLFGWTVGVEAAILVLYFIV